MEADFLQQCFTALMAVDTVNPPGGEEAAARLLQKLFEARGMPATVQRLGNGRANFTAQCGQGTPVLEFNGHLDVVPCPGNWHTPPLQATPAGDRVYGRGACDMKGGLAAMCAAYAAVYERQDTLQGTLRLCFVADEESANAGIKAFQAVYPPADMAVIGEPTGLQVAIAHRGVARFSIRLEGEERHAALSPLADTAVQAAARAILALQEMNMPLQNRRHEVLPPPSIAVTRVRGYEKDNVIPGTVELLTDFRLLPGDTESSAAAQIREALRRAGVQRYTLHTHFFMPGAALPSRDSFVQLCCRVTGQILGRNQQPTAFGASCEQCFALQAGTRAVICGPGSLDQAHTVDEFVEADQLRQAVDCYTALALQILEGD